MAHDHSSESIRSGRYRLLHGVSAATLALWAAAAVFAQAPAGNPLNPMRMTQANFTALVRNPGAPNRMPPYSAKVISDAQLADIYAYLKTLPDAPAAKDIPLLQQIEAEVK